MKRNRLALLGLLAAFPILSGQNCADLADFFGPVTVVTLVNNADDDVRVVISYADDPSISESDLRDSGTEIEITVPDGESRSFRRNCLVMRAVMVETAQLELIGGFGPTASSDVIRQGQGSPSLVCPGLLTFTFDSDNAFDLDVTAN